MKKNAPLAFRIPDELKKALEEIAHREVRSISQICEIFLTIGTGAYRQGGIEILGVVSSKQQEGVSESLGNQEHKTRHFSIFIPAGRVTVRFNSNPLVSDYNAL